MRTGLKPLLAGELLERAARPLSAMPRPFVRWAGSKQRLLREIVDVLPSRMNVYHEPFLGSGALFFLLTPERAVLRDSCAELIDTYEAVRDGTERVLAWLSDMVPSRDAFYRIRAKRSRGRYKRAAEFIYLNKTCWNGLYRVNSDGVFNVPYGRPKTDFIIDPENVRRCSRALKSQGVHLAVGDFEESFERVRSGDLVFLDPPYVTRHNNNGFVDYNETLFSWTDQERLAAAAQRLVRRGAHVVVTNAEHREVLDLYHGFEVRSLRRASTLASDTRKRGRVSEALIFRSP